MKYGRLTIIGNASHVGNRPALLCECDCGVIRPVQRKKLFSGHTQSCGCLQVEKFHENSKPGHQGNPTHGMSHGKEWNAWMGLRSRVKYKYGNRCDKYYSDKGITVAAEWMDDFAAFLTHIGPAPSEHHSVDRIRGGEGYVPGNVRWATIVEQNRNKSDNIVVSWNGADRLLVELAEEYGLPYQTLNWRYQRAGWPIERALTTPIKRMKNNVYPQALATDKAYEAAQATTP